MKKTMLASALLATSITSFANSDIAQEKPALFDQHAWGFSVQSMSIDEQVATSNLIGDSMQGVNFFWQGEVNSLLLGAGAGFLIMDDKGSFDVDVTVIGGGDETREAEASGMNFFAEVGYRHQIEKLNLDLLAGIEGINASRSVSNCSNCPEEDLEIDAGAYLKPRVGYQMTDGFWMDLSYTAYTGGDLSNNLGLVFTFVTN